MGPGPQRRVLAISLGGLDLIDDALLLEGRDLGGNAAQIEVPCIAGKLGATERRGRLVARLMRVLALDLRRASRTSRTDPRLKVAVSSVRQALAMQRVFDPLVEGIPC